MYQRFMHGSFVACKHWNEEFLRGRGVRIAAGSSQELGREGRRDCALAGGPHALHTTSRHVHDACMLHCATEGGALVCLYSAAQRESTASRC